MERTGPRPGSGSSGRSERLCGSGRLRKQRRLCTIEAERSGETDGLFIVCPREAQLQLRGGLIVCPGLGARFSRTGSSVPISPERAAVFLELQNGLLCF